MLGATSGRTTLGGEGLQHQDGSSHLIAATIENCKAYDPAFAGELAVILDCGVREMIVEQQDAFDYITMMNENYAQPDLRPGCEADILRGCYQFNSYPGNQSGGESPESSQNQPKSCPQVTLLGSGAILNEVIRAAGLLAAQGVTAQVFSVTSWSELARDGAACQQRALAGEAPPPQPFITRQLAHSAGPIVAASDYVRAVPESIRAFLPPGRTCLTLGTDGFGRSDTRSALRAFFGVDAASIVRAALHQLQAA